MTTTGPTTQVECPERYRRPLAPQSSAPPGLGFPAGGGRIRDLAVGERARVASLHLYRDTFGKLWIAGGAFANPDQDGYDDIRHVRVERVPAGLRVLSCNPEMIGSWIKTQERPYGDDVWVVEFPKDGP